MLKIQAFYQTQEDLEKADELYKSVTFILNKLRLKGPNGKKELSQGFKDTKAVSCIRDIAEDLAKSQVTFVSRMKTLWSSLLHSQKQFSNSFENYAVPYEYYQGTIFGGAYYVLAKQKTVDDEHLELMETFVSGYAEALPYFNVFKTALTGDTRPLAPRPSAIAAPKTADTKTLRKQFIQGLNARLVQIDAIDWADATMGFDRAVMKELFWGVEDDKLLKTIIKAIINTWNKLVKAKDSRCLATPSGAANLAIAASIDPWKFGGLTRETINKFFDDLWVERNARNTYATFGIEKPIEEPASKKTITISNTEEEKTETVKTDGETEQLREELAKVVAEKKVMSINIESLKNDLLAFQTRDKKGKEVPLLTAKQVAIFLKAILLEHNSLTNNAKNLAPLVQRFGGGWAPTTAEDALGYEVTQNECNELADIFTDYAPKIGNIIRAYPDKFKQVKGEKLQNNLKS